MEWIRGNKIRQRIVLAASVSCFLIVLVLVRNRSMLYYNETSRLTLFLAVLPAFVAFGAFLPWLYLNWFSRPGRGMLLYFKRGFFWLMTLTVLVVFIQFTRLFLLP